MNTDTGVPSTDFGVFNTYTGVPNTDFEVFNTDAGVPNIDFWGSERCCRRSEHRYWRFEHRFWRSEPRCRCSQHRLLGALNTDTGVPNTDFEVLNTDTGVPNTDVDVRNTDFYAFDSNESCFYLLLAFTGALCAGFGGPGELFLIHFGHVLDNGIESRHSCFCRTFCRIINYPCRRI